ncbi:MAG: PIG-L family deacetylase [Acidobacteria bacterium]|nr:PIG-L family deacetylase [Acidobacteriota bacterium]
MTDERVILCVFAHPADESCTAAGTACRYGEEGARVALVTATLGEEGGGGDPPVCTREELPAVRRLARRTRSSARCGRRRPPTGNSRSRMTRRASRASIFF